MRSKRMIEEQLILLENDDHLKHSDYQVGWHDALKWTLEGPDSNVVNALLADVTAG